MANLTVNLTETQRRVVGDLQAYAAELLDNTGSTVDLTGKTVIVQMVNVHDNSSKISLADASSATVDSASQGYVSYTFSSSQVDTQGVYAWYWVIDEATSADQRFPYDGATRRIELVGPNE